MNIAQFLAFVPAAILVAASPGANNFLSLTHGAKAGFGPTAISLAGRLLAYLVLIAAVAAGLGAILERSAMAFAAIKWAGVAYLVYLGIRIWRQRTLELGEGESGGTAWQLARKEFVVLLANPKAILLVTAFLPQFVQPGGGATRQLLLLGAIYSAIEFVAACFYALAGASMRRLEPTPGRVRLINRTSGGMMIGAAGLLAFARRGA